MDGSGRVWVVGRDARSGALFADAWWRDPLLGRSWLECDTPTGRWNLSGDRLALLCAAEPTDTVNDQVYRIWSIVDSTP